MDGLQSVHQKRATKHSKMKKKPIKVVYISNPMKINASASEFRALVQELTGKYSELPEPTRFSDAGNEVVRGINRMVPDGMKLKVVAAGAGAGAGDGDGDDDDDDIDDHVPSVLDPTTRPPQPDDISFEPFDEFFSTSQMMENFTGLLPSTQFVV